MTYSLFLIAHFIGDFILQNTRIVEWKHRSVWGLLFHTSLLTASFLVLLFPYLHDKRIIWAIAINFVFHTAQDYWKIKTAHRWPNPFTPFLLDQISHIVLALLLAHWVADAVPIWGMENPLVAWFYSNQLVQLFCLGVILTSYTSDILLYIIQLSRDKTHRYKRNYKAMLTRITLFSLFFAAMFNLFT